MGAHARAAPPAPGLPSRRAAGSPAEGVAAPARPRAPGLAAAPPRSVRRPEPAGGSRGSRCAPRRGGGSPAGELPFLGGEGTGTGTGTGTQPPRQPPAGSASGAAGRPGPASRVSRRRCSPLLLRLQRPAWQWPSSTQFRMIKAKEKRRNCILRRWGGQPPPAAARGGGGRRRAGLRAAAGERGAGGAPRGSGCRGDRQELTRLPLPLSGAANSEPPPASPPRCGERAEGGGGEKLGSWLSRSPPFAGAPRETKKRKPETPGRGRRGAAERSHRAPQLLPASGGRALPLGTPLRPGDGLSAEGKRYLSRRRGAPRPHALRSRARRGEAAPPTFRGAAPPPSRPAAGAGERLRAAGQPPAGRRGPAAGARARRGGRRGLPATCGRRPRRAYPPPPTPPPPPPSLRPLLLCGGAGAVGRGAAAAAAGPCGLRGDARRRGTEVVLRYERSRRPALAPPGAAPRPRPRLRRALTPARR